MKLMGWGRAAGAPITITNHRTVQGDFGVSAKNDDGCLIDCDCTAEAIDVYLPSVATAGAGFTLGLRKTDTTSNTVRIWPASLEEKIDGNTINTLYNQYGQVWYVCTGSGWAVVLARDFVRANVASGSAVTMATSDQYYDVTSISICPGEWQLSGLVQISSAGGTVTALFGVVSLFSANTTTDQVVGYNEARDYSTNTNAHQTLVVPAHILRSGSGTSDLSRTAATTVYLKGATTHSAGDPTAYGSIVARRFR